MYLALSLAFLKVEFRALYIYIKRTLNSLSQQTRAHTIFPLSLSKAVKWESMELQIYVHDHLTLILILSLPSMPPWTSFARLLRDHNLTWIATKAETEAQAGKRQLFQAFIYGHGNLLILSSGATSYIRSLWTWCSEPVETLVKTWFQLLYIKKHTHTHTVRANDNQMTLTFPFIEFFRMVLDWWKNKTRASENWATEWGTRK